MPKRNLRVTKWLGTTPAIACCSACQREFRVPLEYLKRVTSAQDYLQGQFQKHACESSTTPDPK